MNDSLFVLGAGHVLKKVPSSKFQTEDLFQSLLAEHPQLLTNVEAGDESPRRWLLVKREAGVPTSDGGAGFFAVDHLFLDQDGVPTLVEVKRASDTRARREVVSQMLDYAANAVSFWRAEDLAKLYAATCAQNNVDPFVGLADLLNDESPNTEAFWRSVQANLSSRRIRMIFVADRISPELERIVEFLNEQMSSATVLALELRQFESGSDRIISPRLIGATTRAVAQKNVSAPSAESIDEWIAQSNSPESSRKFIELMDDLGAVCKLAGKAVAVEVGPDGLRVTYLRQGGNASIAVYQLKKIDAFKLEISRAELLAKFERLGFRLSSRNASGEPNFALPAKDSTQWEQLKEFFVKLFDKVSIRADAT